MPRAFSAPLVQRENTYEIKVLLLKILPSSVYIVSGDLLKESDVYQNDRGNGYASTELFDRLCDVSSSDDPQKLFGGLVRDNG
jgi:hypothetical protein